MITSMVLVVAPATAIGAPVTIAVLQGQTPVRAWNGVQVWTDYSMIDKRWHVVVRRAGQITIPAAIAAGDGRLKVDVGPGLGASRYWRSSVARTSAGSLSLTWMVAARSCCPVARALRL
jgi:hypothetical protein